MKPDLTKKNLLAGLLFAGAVFVLVVIGPETVERDLTGKSRPGQAIGLGDLLQGSSLVDSQKWADKTVIAKFERLINQGAGES